MTDVDLFHCLRCDKMFAGNDRNERIAELIGNRNTICEPCAECLRRSMVAKIATAIRDKRAKRG